MGDDVIKSGCGVCFRLCVCYKVEGKGGEYVICRCTWRVLLVDSKNIINTFHLQEAS